MLDAKTQIRARRKQERPAKASGSPDAIVRDIIEGLYQGRYVPGQRLVEADLTQQYEVSRGSVREALSRLAAEGVVSLNLHRGASIRSLTRKEANDVLALVELMIGLAARLAALNIDEAGNREAFKSSYRELMAFEKKVDVALAMHARNRFYRVLVQIGGNTELGRVLPSMHVHLVRTQFRAYYEQAEMERFDSYRRIAQAVLAGETAQAERMGRMHIRHIAVGLQRLPDKAFAADHSL